MSEGKIVATVAGIAFAAVLGLFVLFGSYTTVSPQERAIITNLGSVSRVLDEGFHWKSPFTESVHNMDITIQAFPVSELTYSKDSQIVTAEVTVNYRLKPEAVEQIFREVNRDWEARLVAPAVKDSIKNVVAKYTAQGILDNRATIPAEVKASIVAALDQRGIVVENVLFTNIDFDDAYEEAVRNKQVQEQQALAQANITKQEAEKKEQEILKAEALAEKTRLEAAALASQQGEKVISKIYAEAALELAKKWNGTVPSTYISGQDGGQGGSFLSFLNLNGLIGK